jgi:hypothetical protein
MGQKASYFAGELISEDISKRKKCPALDLRQLREKVPVSSGQGGALRNWSTWNFMPHFEVMPIIRLTICCSYAGRYIGTECCFRLISQFDVVRHIVILMSCTRGNRRAAVRIEMLNALLKFLRWDQQHCAISSGSWHLLSGISRPKGQIVKLFHVM